jgi:hypothetical protein
MRYVVELGKRMRQILRSTGLKYAGHAKGI